MADVFFNANTWILGDSGQFGMGGLQSDGTATGTNFPKPINDGDLSTKAYSDEGKVFVENFVQTIDGSYNIGGSVSDNPNFLFSNFSFFYDNTSGGVLDQLKVRKTSVSGTITISYVGTHTIGGVPFTVGADSVTLTSLNEDLYFSDAEGSESTTSPNSDYNLSANTDYFEIQYLKITDSSTANSYMFPTVLIAYVEGERLFKGLSRLLS